MHYFQYYPFDVFWCGTSMDGKAPWRHRYNPCRWVSFAKGRQRRFQRNPYLRLTLLGNFGSEIVYSVVFISFARFIIIGFYANHTKTPLITQTSTLIPYCVSRKIIQIGRSNNIRENQVPWHIYFTASAVCNRLPATERIKRCRHGCFTISLWKYFLESNPFDPITLAKITRFNLLCCGKATVFNWLIMHCYCVIGKTTKQLLSPVYISNTYVKWRNNIYAFISTIN